MGDSKEQMAVSSTNNDIKKKGLGTVITRIKKMSHPSNKYCVGLVWIENQENYLKILKKIGKI